MRLNMLPLDRVAGAGFVGDRLVGDRLVADRLVADRFWGGAFVAENQGAEGEHPSRAEPSMIFSASNVCATPFHHVFSKRLDDRWRWDGRDKRQEELILSDGLFWIYVI
jgi:hypothetical protein